LWTLAPASMLGAVRSRRLFMENSRAKPLTG
jgi:hypothetical protein